MDNFTPINNDFLEIILKWWFSWTELSIILLVYRKTIWWGKENDWISLSQFMEFIPVSKPNIIKSLKVLKLVNILELVKKWNSWKSFNIRKINLDTTTFKLVNKMKLVKSRKQTSKQNDTQLVTKSLHTKDTITKDTITKDKPTKIKIFEADSFEYKIVSYFINKHKELQNTSFLYLLNKEWEEKLINKWNDEIRKMKEIDKYSEEQITFIIKYLFQNDFWKEQISSMEKFRKKNKSWIPYFVVLINEAKKENKSKQNTTIGAGIKSVF